jgi:chitodextrinase
MSAIRGASSHFRKVVAICRTVGTGLFARRQVAAIFLCVTFLFLPGRSWAQAGLVAAYGFNEGSGTTVTDVSGNNNTGTISGATRTAAGKFGGALVFDGTSAWVTVPDSASLRLTTGMTLEAWVNPSAVTSVWRDVIYKGNDSYYLEATSTNGGRPGAGGTFGTAFGTAALAENTWTHLAVTYDRVTLRLYVNGLQVSSVARTASIATSTNPLQLGGDNIYGQYFQGRIDEVRVYNRALAPEEIRADMATAVGDTPPPSDTAAPSAPTNLTPTAVDTSRVNLSWTASTDNVGVTGYLMERCQGAGCSAYTQISTPSGTAYSDTGLLPNTTYRYQMRATDAAGNLSPYSNVAQATTQVDTQPPTAPGTLTATAISGTQVNLSWGPSQDDAGVAGYRMERCQGAGCTDFVKVMVTPSTPTTFGDTGLVPSTNYSYLVRAADAAGNLGPYSNAAAVTTLATVPELVAAYAFDEGSGTTVGDSSGKGNTGTIQNATWTTTGKYGKALVFNGTNARVSIPDSASLRLTSAMTLAAWVNPTTVNNAWRDVIYKGNDNYFLEATSTNNARPAAGGTFGSGGGEAYGTAALTANTWTHLAATYDGAMLRLYVNGVQVSSVARTGNLATSANPLEIGGDSIFGQNFEGTIDEVRVYNVALTPMQIQSDMNTPTGGGSAPLLSLNPNSIDFGNQSTGTTSSSRTATLTNVGDVVLSLGGITVSGPNGGDFTQSNTCRSSLAPRESCTINVAFTPAAAGTRAATITLSDNAAGAPHTISLAGVGTGFSITPRTAVLTPGLAQQFATTGGSGAAVNWAVDGVFGGTAASGTITSTGLYSPPNTAGTHTVTATTSDQSQSSATVFVTNHPGVFTHRNDNLRTGQNLNETVLTPANVNALGFGKLLSYSLDGMAMASPLYVAGVNIPGQGVRNVVYVATQHNTVYAFDAEGLSSNPLWQKSFINPAAGVTPVPSCDTGECFDIAPEVGITGTPVIDPSTGTLYVVAKTKEVSGSTTNYVQRLHALDITSGADKFGGPVILQASVPGNGHGAQAGNVPFDALHENQRPALLLNNGVVYIAFGGHGDVQPYHGWVLGYSASTLQRVMAFNASPNGEGAGIWQANGGPAADAAGNIYFITGDGTFNADASGGTDYGSSFVKISPSGTLVDYFTPHDQESLSANNFDLGAAGPMLLPDQTGAHPHLLVSAGKNNTIYLLDRGNMGRYNSSNDNQVVQSLVNIFPFGTPEPGNYSAPVYFNGTVYFGPVADNIQAFSLSNGLLSTSPTSRSLHVYPYPGAALAISSNGTANGILWAVQRNGDCGVQVSCGSAAPGVLRAYDAQNLGMQLYSSDQSGSRDALDYAVKFSVPLVANGKVFVPSMGKLTIYGLLP